MIRLAALASLVLVVDRWPSGVSKVVETLEESCLDISFTGTGHIEYDVQTTTTVAFLKIASAELGNANINTNNLYLEDCLVSHTLPHARIVALNSTELSASLGLGSTMLFMQCPGDISYQDFTGKYGDPYLYRLDEYDYQDHEYRPSEARKVTRDRYPGLLDMLCPGAPCVGGVCSREITGRTKHRGLLALVDLYRGTLFDVFDIRDSRGAPITYDAGYSPYAVFSEGEYTVTPLGQPVSVWYSDTTAVVCLGDERWFSSGMQDVLAVAPGDALRSNHPLYMVRSNMSVVYRTDWRYAADQRLEYPACSDSTARCKIARHIG